MYPHLNFKFIPLGGELKIEVIALKIDSRNR